MVNTNNLVDILYFLAFMNLELISGELLSHSHDIYNFEEHTAKIVGMIIFLYTFFIYGQCHLTNVS